MEIEDSVDPPKFFDAPAKKGRAKAAPKPVDQVLENLKMLGLVVKKKGTVQESFISIQDGFATACLGELTVGCPLDFGATKAVVRLHDLLEAKKVAGAEFACTFMGHNQMVIVADDVRMVIETDLSHTWQAPAPDSPIAPATDRLRAALVELAPFATSDRPDIVGILCQGYTAVATNGFAMLEAWHGVDMPPGLRLPVSFVKKLEKIKRPVAQFGFSPYSFTIWFEDGSYIRTAMHKGDYANYQAAFTDSTEYELVDLPDEFYKTLKSIIAFAKDGVVYFKDGQIYTAKQTEAASSFKHESIPNGFGFNIHLLLLIAKHAPTVKFMNTCDRIQFECGNVRGSVMGLDMRTPQRITDPVVDPEFNDNFEDEIPY